MTVQRIEWEGQEYEIKYSFKLVQRLKSEGVNLPRIHRLLQQDAGAAGDYADDVAGLICHCLREAGAPVDEDKVWRECLGNVDFARACWSLFFWLVTQHYAQSPNAPKAKNAASQGKAKQAKR